MVFIHITYTPGYHIQKNYNYGTDKDTNFVHHITQSTNK